MFEPDQDAPRISVLIGAYNAASTLPEAIEAIQTQTHSDWELIIFDDGSTDDTLSVAQRFAAEDDRIRVFSNGRNLGLAPTLNNCLAQSRGQVLARMDADDHCDPHRFQKQISFLDSNPEAALVGSAVLIFDADGTWGRTKPKESPQPVDLVHGTPFAHVSVMIRREVLEAVGGYDTADRCWRVEGFDTWRARWNEAGILARVVRGLRFSPCLYFRAARPLVLCVLPKQIYLRIHRNRHATNLNHANSDRSD